MTDIEQIRMTIDRLDTAIVTLLAERESSVRKIVKHKTDEDAVRGLDRVERVIERIKGLAEECGLRPSIAEAVYRTIIYEFTELQMAELRKVNAVRKE